MATFGLHYDALNLAWRSLREKLPRRRRAASGCSHVDGLWNRFVRWPERVLLEGAEYCLGECLESVLQEAIGRVRSVSRRPRVPHRIPLGLLLLSRQQLTAEQLRQAVAAQRVAGQGRIGEWLISLGYVTQSQITAALARQWSCPVLRTTSFAMGATKAPPMPLTLLACCGMVPVGYVESSTTLHIACSDCIDYTVLYAIEHMTGCHTEPCMALPEFVNTSLQAIAGDRIQREVVFECATDAAEFARIVRSYANRLGSLEIRIAPAGRYTWVRMVWRNRPPLDLLARLPGASC